jgi:hypothetical protein
MPELFKADFYYDCEECHARIPATFANPHLPDEQIVIKQMGPKSETTFRCQAHRVDPRDRP